MPEDGAQSWLVDDGFLFIGRTFEEYRRLFALEPTDLTGGRILDCAAGPSSFAAVASTVGADVWAVDPMYGRTAGELESACSTALRRTERQLREKRDLFEWAFYGDVDSRCRFLRASYERFLAHYVCNPGRYVAAGLPSLPFQSNTFDLALSAHFLFLYDDRLSLAFHVDALRELARVAAAAVRVFPLAGLDREPSDYVDDVVAALRGDDLSVDLVEVPFEFQPGATEMLAVSNVADYDRA